MAKSKIVQYPLRHGAPDKQNTLWSIGVHRVFTNTYRFQYESGEKGWTIRIEASAFENVAALVDQCRHIMGWDIPTEGKEAEAL